MRHAPALLMLLFANIARADGPYIFPSDGFAGMTCDFYDSALRIPWQHGPAGWIDAAGKVKGDVPFAKQDFDFQRTQTTLDVTRALAATADHVPGAIVLRSATPKGGIRLFASREAAANVRPRLDVVTDDGTTASLVPVADTTIDCTTNRSLGVEPGFRVGPKHTAVLRFDLTPAVVAHLRSASLTLTAQKTYAPGAV